MVQGIAAVEPDKITDVFCADCDTGAAADLAAQYRDEPLAPFVKPAQINAGEDRAISPVNQQQMTAGISCRATASLPTSHSPFLSVPPGHRSAPVRRRPLVRHR
jgi:hypothetical protein